MDTTHGGRGCLLGGDPPYGLWVRADDWRFWPAKSKPEEKKARGALETILQRFTVEELKAELRLRHHGVTGVKTVLVSRLAATKPWAAGNQIETILSLLGQNSYLTVRLEDVVSTERAGDWLRQAKVKRT